jgi:hypothetical protein
MTLDAWPSTVPAPQREDMRRVPVGAVSRRRCQSGRVEARRFGGAPPDMVEAPILLTVAEYADLVEFYEDDLEMGTEWFTADWIEDLGYTASHAGRFIGYPRVDGQTGVRRASCAFHIEHQDYIGAWD